RKWDVHSGKELRRFSGHTNFIYGCALSHDAQRALSASGDGTVRLWDLTNGQLLSILEGHTSSVYTCAFSYDGSLALSASRDSTPCLWDISGNVEQRQRVSHARARSAYSGLLADDDLILTFLSASADPTPGIWNAANTADLRATIGQAIRSCAL